MVALRALNKTELDEITKTVYRAAKDVLGDKLKSAYLYGSYARGDYDDESDVDITVLADVPMEEASKTRSKIRQFTGDIDLEYCKVISVSVTNYDLFCYYSDTLPYYMNVLKEGISLYA